MNFWSLFIIAALVFTVVITGNEDKSYNSEVIGTISPPCYVKGKLAPSKECNAKP